MLKNLLRTIIHRAGYNLVKISKPNFDTDLYIKLYGSEAIKNRNFYNIGSGDFHHPCWTTVDIDPLKYSEDKEYTKFLAPDIEFDLTSLGKLPIESGVAEIVYSSHTIEHVPDAAVKNMFSESHRILKNGGVMRITCPNIDLSYRAYKNNDREYFHWINYYSIPQNYARVHYAVPMDTAPIGQLFLECFAAAISCFPIEGEEERLSDNKLAGLLDTLGYEKTMDYCVSLCSAEIQKKHPGHHINWWNPSKILAMAKEMGFSNVYISSYQQSTSAVLRNSNFFDSTNPRGSLYFEAVK